jgi:hypothetical protein
VLGGELRRGGGSRGSARPSGLEAPGRGALRTPYTGQARGSDDRGRRWRWSGGARGGDARAGSAARLEERVVSAPFDRAPGLSAGATRRAPRRTRARGRGFPRESRGPPARSRRGRSARGRHAHRALGSAPRARARQGVRRRDRDRGRDARGTLCKPADARGEVKVELVDAPTSSRCAGKACSSVALRGSAPRVPSMQQARLPQGADPADPTRPSGA